MPPFLRNRWPVNRPEPQKPLRGYLCVCFECVEHTSLDPITNALVNGQYVSQKTLTEHKRNEKMRQKAIQDTPMKGGQITDLTEQLSTQSLHQGLTAGSTRTPPAHNTHEQWTRVERGVKHALVYLESALKEFQEKKVNYVFYYDLVFISPPTPTSNPITLWQPFCHDAQEINTGPFALDRHSCKF
ncbi:hypothetical protein C8R48DRAFT_774568 [Suillus tomentosus]|nr:hypothetical protein C8R48DRAFT_774568 [Suillus tomentosus]